MPEDTAADGRNGEDADGDGDAVADSESDGGEETRPEGDDPEIESPASEPEGESDAESVSSDADDAATDTLDATEVNGSQDPAVTDDDESSGVDDPESTPETAGVATDPGGQNGAGSSAGEGDTEVGSASAGAGENVDLPPDVQQYARFKKVDGSRYERVNDFLRDRTYITAREWAIARLCADFRTETGVEMTKIGENLPELVPFMTDTYTPQAVNQARAAFEDKVRMAGATFLYGAMCDFFTAEELDDLIYEVTEVAKFLLEVEGVDLAVEDELETEDRISDVMREVRTASEALRNGPVECPECGHEISNGEHANGETEE